MIPIWKTYIYLSYRDQIGKDASEWRVQTSGDIIFRVSSPTWGTVPATNPDSNLYHYLCETCHYSSGNPDEVFRTSADFAKNMKNGPTGDQQIQMSVHARQHSIMWSWVKSLEGK